MCSRYSPPLSSFLLLLLLLLLINSCSASTKESSFSLSLSLEQRDDNVLGLQEEPSTSNQSETRRRRRKGSPSSEINSLGSNNDFSLHGDAKLELLKNGSGAAVVISLNRPMAYSTGQIVYNKPISFQQFPPPPATAAFFFTTALTFSMLSMPASSPSHETRATAPHAASSTSPIVSLSLYPATHLSPPSAAAAADASAIFSVHLIISADQSVGAVRIDVGGKLLVQSSGISTRGDADLRTEEGQEKHLLLHCSIHYDGDAKRIQVTTSNPKDPSPMTTLLSYPLDFTNLLSNSGDKMLVCIGSSTGNSTRAITINSWTFSLTRAGHHVMMHSEPLDPRSFPARSTPNTPLHDQQIPYSWGVLTTMLLLAACSVLAMLYAIVARWPISPVADYPREAGYENIMLVKDTKVERAEACD